MAWLSEALGAFAEQMPADEVLSLMHVCACLRCISKLNLQITQEVSPRLAHPARAE